MANSYRTVNDPSIFVQAEGHRRATSIFLTWTTTPWTLPSNVALAVGTDFDYVRVRHGDEVLILAEARLGVLDPGGRRPRSWRSSRAPTCWAAATSSCSVRAARRGRGRLRGGRGRLRDPRFGHRHRPHGAGLRRGRLPGGQAREPGLLQARGRQRPVHRRGRALGRAARQEGRPADHQASAAPRASCCAEETYTPRLPLPRPLRQPADLLRHAQLVHQDQRDARPAGRGQPGHHLGAARGGQRPLRQLAGRQHRLEPEPQPFLGHAPERLDLRRVRRTCTCPPAAPI